MNFAPQNHWAAYRAQSLSVEERFAICAKLFEEGRAADPTLDDWDQSAWEEKLAIRLRMVDAFFRLDELRAKRASAEQ